MIFKFSGPESDLSFRRPEEVYFPNVHLFSDIEHIRADMLQQSMKPFLQALGIDIFM